MKYPLNVDLMKVMYRECFEDFEDYCEQDDEYIETLTNYINNAYNQGVLDGMKKAGEQHE